MVRLEHEADQQELMRRRLNSQFEEARSHNTEIIKQVEEEEIKIQKLSQDLDMLQVNVAKMNREKEGNK